MGFVLDQVEGQAKAYLLGSLLMRSIKHVNLSLEFLRKSKVLRVNSESAADARRRDVDGTRAEVLVNEVNVRVRAAGVELLESLDERLERLHHLHLLIVLVVRIGQHGFVRVGKVQLESVDLLSGSSLLCELIIELEVEELADHRVILQLVRVIKVQLERQF